MFCDTDLAQWSVPRRLKVGLHLADIAFALDIRVGNLKLVTPVLLKSVFVMFHVVSVISSAILCFFTFKICTCFILFGS